MPFSFLRIDHYEPSPVAGQSTVFARARYQHSDNQQEVTQEFLFPDLTTAQDNAERFALAYLPTINGVRPDAPVAPSRVISKIEFLKRFGDANMVAVLTAAKSAPTIEAWVFWFNAASEIHLDDEPKVVEGIQALMDAQLVDPGTLTRVTA
jgi:hypothetical protein